MQLCGNQRRWGSGTLTVLDLVGPVEGAAEEGDRGEEDGQADQPAGLAHLAQDTYSRFIKTKRQHNLLNKTNVLKILLNSSTNLPIFK